VGHGETYQHEQDILWWSKGGVLHGQSPPRLAFLREVLESLPVREMAPDRTFSPGNVAVVKPGEAYLVYFTKEGLAALELAGESIYRVDAIDPWAMTIAPLDDAEAGLLEYVPPRTQTALRLVAYHPDEPRRPRAAAPARERPNA
jgi:hypothetical protein